MVDLLRECLKHKQKLSHDFICPRGKSHFYVYKQGCKGFIACFKKVFKFRRHYMPTIKGYYDISIKHTNGQQYTHFGTISLHEHIENKQNSFSSGLTELN